MKTILRTDIMAMDMYLHFSKARYGILWASPELDQPLLFR